LTPSTYFRELVEPAVADFEANQISVRLAYTACMFAYHFADAVAAHRHPGGDRGRIRNELGKVRGDLADLSAWFRTVEGIATVAKHVEVMDEKMPVKPKIEDTHLGQAAAFASGQYWASGASCAGRPTVVRTRDDAGRPVDVLHCVRDVRRAIETYLDRERLP
jgi:hypothetical protein